MYRVSNKFREQAYSGEALYNANLVINGVTVPNEQIASITISDPIIDTSVETFYLGSFISKQITIKFKNLDGLTIETGLNVYLEIGQEIDGEYEYVPIGNFLIDDLDENYYTTCEITCLDYAVLFKPAVDYSPAFSDGKATIDDILIWLCRHFGVELGEYPTINGDVEIGVYDGSISGKQWISYIAEIKGCNAKIDRTGTLQLIPFNNTSQVTIDATTNEEWEVGEPYSISRIIYYDAVRNYTFGDTTANTLYIRQDNPFIVDSSVVENIYDNIFITSKTASGETINISDGSTTTTGKLIIQGNMSQYQDEGDRGVTAEGTSLEIDDINTNKVSQVTLQGNTFQYQSTGKNLFDLEKWYEGKSIINANGCSINVQNTFITLSNPTKQDAYNTGTWHTRTNPTSSDIEIIKPLCVEVKPNTHYVISWNADNFIQVFIFQYNNDFGYITHNACPISLTDNSYAFTTGSNTKYIGIRFDNEAYNRNLITTTLNIKDIMIEEESQATEYEPFSNGEIAPSPNYPQNINVVTGEQKVSIMGKNILDTSNISTGSLSGLDISLQNTKLILNGTNSSGGYIIPSKSYTGILLQEGTYTLSVKILAGTATFGNNNTVVYIGDKNSDTLLGSVSLKTAYNNNNKASSSGFITIEKTTPLYFEIYTNGSCEYNDIQVGIQLEKNEQMTEYEDYIINNYIVNLGKNLFDKNDITSGSYIADDGSIGTNVNIFYSNYIPVKPNTTYTISGKNNSWANTALYDSDKTFIIRIGDGTNFTTTSTTYYIRTNGRLEYLDSIQIEEGNAPTNYSEYFTPIELCQIEDYQDYIYKESGKWFLHKEINKMILNGNEQWGKNSTRFSLTLTGYGNGTKPILCTHFIPTDDWDYHNTQNYTIIFFRDEQWANARLSINDSDFSTVNDFKNWLSTNNVIVYFPLATPTNTEITNQTLINELNVLYNAELLEKTNIDAYSNTLEANINVRYNIVLPTPTSDLPSEVKTVTGDNTFVIHSKNLCPSLPTGTNNGVNFVKKENGSTDIIGTSNDIINYNAITNKLLKKGTYTLSVEMSVLNPINSSQILMRKMTGESIATINLWNLQSQTITLEEDTLIRIYFYSNSNKTYDTNIKIQLEESTPATTYQNYFRDEYELNLGNIELCKLNGKQDYFHKVGEDWYIHKEIGKIVLDGTESGWSRFSVLTNTTAYQRNVDIGYNKTTGNSANAYVNYFKGLPNGYDTDDECFWFNNQGYFRIRINTLKASTQPEFRNWLSSHALKMYYELEENEEIKITDNILINQLNEIYNIHLHNGTNIIEVETINKNPGLDLLYFIPIDFTIYSLKAKNYGDISLDAYDIIDYTIQEEGEEVKHYMTYNNNVTTYEMNISSTVDTQISNKQKEVTTNHIGGDIPTKVKMLKTNLDHVNNRIEMLVEEQDEQDRRINQTIIDVNSTRNIFQITGGSNLIKNSQFLYDDPEVEEDNVKHRTYWNLTDNGTLPFNNLGDGYDSSLIGQTVSLAKIQLRNTILESRNLNITDLQIGQVYTLNYFYRQENLTTTRLELFDANNNHVTYDVVNEQTGITETKDIDITYSEEQTRITNQTFQFIAPTSTLKLKITTTTTSGETTNGNFYLYDLMLNSGDKKSWELASSEIYSTTIQMSNLGLQVITADEDIATLLTAQGFQVVKYDNGRFGAIVTSFTKKGIKTDEIESNLISTGKFVMTEATINNNEHHIEYFVD